MHTATARHLLLLLCHKTYETHRQVKQAGLPELPVDDGPRLLGRPALLHELQLSQRELARHRRPGGGQVQRRLLRGREAVVEGLDETVLGEHDAAGLGLAHGLRRDGRAPACILTSLNDDLQLLQSLTLNFDPAEISSMLRRTTRALWMHLVRASNQMGSFSTPAFASCLAVPTSLRYASVCDALRIEQARKRHSWVCKERFADILRFFLGVL